jgi:hypothetical protein
MFLSRQDIKVNIRIRRYIISQNFCYWSLYSSKSWVLLVRRHELCTDTFDLSSPLLLGETRLEKWGWCHVTSRKVFQLAVLKFASSVCYI